MKTVLSTAALFLGIAQAAHAGSTQAFVDCVSASGRTKVSAFYPGDSMEAGVLFSIDGQKLAWINNDVLELRRLNPGVEDDEYSDGELAKIEAKDVIKKGVLAIKVSAPNGQTVFRFQALKGTAKIKHTQYGGSTGTFKAKAQGHDPRNGGESKLIQLSCKYNYSL